ncbi:uncharacterized protein [Argopecten irradians]
MITTSRRAIVLELTRYVHACLIPTAVKQDDILTLTKLLEYDGHGISDRVAREIQNLLFNTDVNFHKLDILLECVEIQLSVVRRKTSSSKTSRNTLPNVVLMLAFVFYIDVETIQNKNETLEKLSMLKNILDNTNYADAQTIERYLKKAVVLMIEGIKDMIQRKRSSCAQLKGSWREELMDENTITNISCNVPKMSLTEQYSLMVRFLVQVHLGVVPSERLIIFIHTSLKTIARRTDIQHLYPLLVLICQGAKCLLNRHGHQDLQTPETQMETNKLLCEILKTCVEKIKNKSKCKEAIQDELMVLMFHRSTSLARNIHNTISSLTQVSLSDKIPAYLQTILGFLGLTLESDKCLDGRNPLPRWHEFKGYMAGHKGVSVNVLLPGNGTDDLKTYIQSAKKDPSNRRHYNTMKMLKTLLGDDTHPNIRRLIAYQFQPMPVFYMTEMLLDATLSTYLLNKRSCYEWQPVKTLGAIASKCVEVVRFLHGKKIVHRNLIADSFKYRRHDELVLSDLSIARYGDDDSAGSGTFVKDIECDFIPTRWSAPESLLDDQYDARSDTWMVGLLIYEIFTHGFHPFRNDYATKIDDTMENVVFNNLAPRWYSCIPCPVHEIIVGCVKTKPDERLSLSQVQQALDSWLQSSQSNDGKKHMLDPETFDRKQSEYPELDENQGEPERGPTEQLKELKKLNKRATYVNKRELRRMSMYPYRIQIREEQLKAADHPIIERKGGCLVIREPVSEAFIDHTFSKMVSRPDFMTTLTISDTPEKHPRQSTTPNGLIYTLVYQCQNGSSLLEISQARHFGDPSDIKNELSYLQVVESLVRFVDLMHERHWILRDICCSTTYRTYSDGRVIMPRLGRMIKDRRRVSRIEACIIDKEICINDRRNWMPAEVINGGQFSQAGDVYMVAMTIYEFYCNADLSKDPMHNRLASVPFAMVKPEQLLEELAGGAFPKMPESCPQWLYVIMKKCWDRDLTKRPTAAEILYDISERLKSKYEQTHAKSNGTFYNDNTGSSDFSVTYRKELCTSNCQPALPPRRHSTDESAQRKENDYQSCPQRRKGLDKKDGTKFRSKYHSGLRGSTTPPNRRNPSTNDLVPSDPVYRNSNEVSSPGGGRDADSVLSPVVMRRRRNEFTHQNATNGGYLTCVPITSDKENGLRQYKPVYSEWDRSTDNISVPEFRNRISGEIHLYDNHVDERRKRLESRQRRSSNYDQTFSIQTNTNSRQSNFMDLIEVENSRNNNTNGAAGFCSNENCDNGSVKSRENCMNGTGSDTSRENCINETGSVASRENCTIETGSVSSRENCTFETGSVISRDSCTTETGSVSSRENCTNETGSVVSCGNSTSGNGPGISYNNKGNGSCLDETGSVKSHESCTNKTGSVVSCGNSTRGNEHEISGYENSSAGETLNVLSEETESMVSCGNSTDGTKSEMFTETESEFSCANDVCDFKE